MPLLGPTIFPSLVVEVESHLVDEYDMLFLEVFQPMVRQKPLNVLTSFFLVFECVGDQFHPSNPLVAEVGEFLEGFIPAVPLHADIGVLTTQS